jgi:hypothetical protein
MYINLLEVTMFISEEFFIMVESRLEKQYYGPVSWSGNAEHFLSMGGFRLASRPNLPNVLSVWHDRSDDLRTAHVVANCPVGRLDGPLFPAVRLCSSADALPG